MPQSSIMFISTISLLLQIFSSDYRRKVLKLLVLLELIASLLLYNKLHPELKLSQLEFLRSLVKQYIQNHRATLATLDVPPHIAEMETNGLYLISTSQGRWKYCKKNTTNKC